MARAARWKTRGNIRASERGGNYRALVDGCFWRALEDQECIRGDAWGGEQASARGRRRDKRERRSTIDERVGRQTPSCRDLLHPRSDRRRRCRHRRRCRRHHRRRGSPLKSARPALAILLTRHSSRPSDALPSDHPTLTHPLTVVAVTHRHTVAPLPRTHLHKLLIPKTHRRQCHCHCGERGLRKAVCRLYPAGLRADSRDLLYAGSFGRSNLCARRVRRRARRRVLRICLADVRHSGINIATVYNILQGRASRETGWRTRRDAQHKRRGRCVIKLRIVRGGLIVLAARFKRSQKDNCSIFPLICETPRGLRWLVYRQRGEGKRERYVCARYRYIRLPFVNISILMI